MSTMLEDTRPILGFIAQGVNRTEQKYFVAADHVCRIEATVESGQVWFALYFDGEELPGGRVNGAFVECIWYTETTPEAEKADG